MSRAADIAWYLDALGAAAEVGVDVFAREDLAGDWLEVIGLWQPGDARTGEANMPYTPHPEFWVAALWNKLMDVRVLGANATNTTAATAAAAVVSDDDTWLVKPGFSSVPLAPPPAPPAPPPALHALAVRTFAHCSKLKAGAVMFAVAVSPCVRTESVDLRLPKANTLTTW
jgi:hypothetical protein